MSALCLHADARSPAAKTYFQPLCSVVLHAVGWFARTALKKKWSKGIPNGMRLLLLREHASPHYDDQYAVKARGIRSHTLCTHLCMCACVLWGCMRKQPAGAKSHTHEE